MTLSREINGLFKKALIYIISFFFFSTHLFAQRAMYHASNRSVLTSGSSTSVSNALDFDGINDRVISTNDDKFKLSVGTIEGWIKTGNAGSSYCGVFGKTFAYFLYLYNNTLIVYDWGGGGNRSTGITLNDNSWHHIAMTFNSGVNNGTLIYIDGILKLTTTMTISSQDQPFTIGSVVDPYGQFYTGSIDDVRVWNVIRTPSQIQANMNIELLGSETGLVAYYTFNQGTTAGDNSAITSATDKTANALNGNLNNFAKTGATSNFVAGKVSNTSNSVSITDGLVLNLDAGNSASYSGTGTTWTDLSGNGNNGTITNSPTYNSANGGSFLFDGSSKYASLTPSKLPTGTSDRTVITIVKTPTSFAFLNHIIHWGSTSTNQAYGLSLSNGQLNSHTWGVYPGQGATVSPATNYFFATTYTHSSALHKFWINGVSQGSGISASIVTGTTDARVGQRITGAEGWGPSGQIYQILVYNRSLSNAEILQIFNDQKGRYGL